MDAIIKNPDGKIDVLELKNNRILSYTISKYGYEKSNNREIDNLILKLFYNPENCVYLTDSSGYKIYYDRETKLKHFIKDGKENVELLFRYNGKDSILYFDNGSINKFVKRLIIAGCVIIVSFTSLSIFYEEYKESRMHDMKYTVSQSYTEEEIQKMNELGPLDYEEALNLIKDSDLDEDTKSKLMNEDLFKLAFKYYEGTPMEYAANIKFSNITIKTYDNTDEGGYFSFLEPNVIHIGNDLSSRYNDVLYHEFIHLLQYDAKGYNYLNEALAEIIRYEYFSEKDSEMTIIGEGKFAYASAVKNIKLLIEIIGPEPLLKASFGGDDSELINILESNLSKSDSKSLLEFLSLDSSMTSESESVGIGKVMRDILFKLYKNIYGKDITEDENIMYSFIYDEKANPVMMNDRTYINPQKMGDKEKIKILIDCEYLQNKGCITLDFVDFYQKDLSYEEAVACEDKSELKFTENIVTNKIYGFIDYDNDTCRYYLLDEPASANDYVDEDIDTTGLSKLPGKYIDILEALKRGYVIATQTKSKNEIKNFDGWYYYASSQCYTSKFPTVDVDNGYITAEVDSIKNRFPNQFENTKSEKSKG